MPLKVKAKDHSEYMRTTTHTNFLKPNTHSNNHPSNAKKVLILLGVALILAIVIISLVLI